MVVGRAPAPYPPPPPSPPPPSLDPRGKAKSAADPAPAVEQVYDLAAWKRAYEPAAPNATPALAWAGGRWLWPPELKPFFIDLMLATCVLGHAATLCG